MAQPPFYASLTPPHQALLKHWELRNTVLLAVCTVASINNLLAAATQLLYHHLTSATWYHIVKLKTSFDTTTL
jgi:hypothetical protein